MAVWRKFRLIKALCAIRKYMQFVPDIKISGQAHLCSYLWIYAVRFFKALANAQKNTNIMVNFTSLKSFLQFPALDCQYLKNYKAAVGADNLTGDKFCVGGNQPGHGGGDVFRLAEATQRGFFF